MTISRRAFFKTSAKATAAVSIAPSIIVLNRQNDAAQEYDSSLQEMENLWVQLFQIQMKNFSG